MVNSSKNMSYNLEKTYKVAFGLLENLADERGHGIDGAELIAHSEMFV